MCRMSRPPFPLHEFKSIIDNWDVCYQKLGHNGVDSLTSEEKAEIEAVVAALSTSVEPDERATCQDMTTFQLLKYQVANDNAPRAWLNWVGLALTLSVPISLAVALVGAELGML